MRDTLRYLAEVALLGVAYFFAVPPTASTSAPYGPMPGLAFAGVAFAASLALGVWRKGEKWPFAAAKLGLFVVFAFVIYLRVVA
jgi:hypothetical protein